MNLTTGGALDSEEEAEAVGDAGSAQAPVDTTVRPVYGSERLNPLQLDDPTPVSVYANPGHSATVRQSADAPILPVTSAMIVNAQCSYPVQKTVNVQRSYPVQKVVEPEGGLYIQLHHNAAAADSRLSQPIIF